MVTAAYSQEWLDELGCTNDLAPARVTRRLVVRIWKMKSMCGSTLLEAEIQPKHAIESQALYPCNDVHVSVRCGCCISMLKDSTYLRVVKIGHLTCVGSSTRVHKATARSPSSAELLALQLRSAIVSISTEPLREPQKGGMPHRHSSLAAAPRGYPKGLRYRRAYDLGTVYS